MTDETTDPCPNPPQDPDRPKSDNRAPGHDANSATDPDCVSRPSSNNLGQTDQLITPTSPDSFGLVQVWWGDGKGKTTAALGMGFRAAGHGYRVHILQYMKGGADSVEDVRGEYNAVAVMPGLSLENCGHYGWHALPDGSDDRDHAAEARAGLSRTQELLAAAEEADIESPLHLDGPPEQGMHMLVLDEVLYAVERDLVSADEVTALVEEKPPALELVLTGGHTQPSYLFDHADLVSHVRKELHPLDQGQRARRGTEY